MGRDFVDDPAGSRKRFTELYDDHYRRVLAGTANDPLGRKGAVLAIGDLAVDGRAASSGTPKAADGAERPGPVGLPDTMSAGSRDRGRRDL